MAFVLETQGTLKGKEQCKDITMNQILLQGELILIYLWLLGTY